MNLHSTAWLPPRKATRAGLPLAEVLSNTRHKGPEVQFDDRLDPPLVTTSPELPSDLQKA